MICRQLAVTIFGLAVYDWDRIQRWGTTHHWIATDAGSEEYQRDPGDPDKWF